MDSRSKKAHEDRLIKEHKIEGVSWESIRGDVCKLIEFIPFEESKTRPRAFVIIKASKYAKLLKMPIFHKEDYKNLSDSVKQRKHKQEIILFWYDKYSNMAYKLSSAALPKLIIMICPEHSFELISDSAYRPDLQGEARYLAHEAIREFRPEVLK